MRVLRLRHGAAENVQNAWVLPSPCFRTETLIKGKPVGVCELFNGHNAEGVQVGFERRTYACQVA